MKICATIPIKERSTRVPNKNFRELKGKPLFRHIIDNCLSADCFNDIYVDTDSDLIKNYCESVKIKYINRDPSLALDTANGNDVFHYDIKNIEEYDYYFQLYATAPFLKTETIRDCVDKLVHSSKYDSILTASEEYGWYWYQNQPVNYQPNILPRSQDAIPLIKESTGLYGISKSAYNKYRCRVGAKPYFYILKDELERVDLDTLEDFSKAEYLINHE